MERISKHISYQEGIRSETARKNNINNTPGTEQLKAMKLVAEKVFEPLREHLREPILVTSFFRSWGVNSHKDVKGSKTSSHLKGEAMDIMAPANAGYNNADMFAHILKNLDYDQLIWEYGTDQNPAWVHVSYRETGNRKQVLKAVNQNGKTTYAVWSGLQ